LKFQQPKLFQFALTLPFCPASILGIEIRCSTAIFSASHQANSAEFPTPPLRSDEKRKLPSSSKSVAATSQQNVLGIAGRVRARWAPIHAGSPAIKTEVCRVAPKQASKSRRRGGRHRAHRPSLEQDIHRGSRGDFNNRMNGAALNGAEGGRPLALPGLRQRPGADPCARFYAARGFDTTAHAYLREARRGCLRWSASGKVRQLEQLHPHLRDAPVPASPTVTIGAPADELDVGTAAKASQAVSSEIVLGDLIKMLLRIAVEHAGAERGSLILFPGDEPRMAAEATPGRGGQCGCYNITTVLLISRSTMAA
jgi:hypothetical protein